MRQVGQGAAGAEGAEPGLPDGTPRSRRRVLGEGRRWLNEPRSAVLIVLGGVLAVGGGWKLLQAWKARRLVARLGEVDVTPAEVEAAALAGRGALPELFRLLGEPPTPGHRAAAARSIASLWARDDLVAEEEQALVRRTYSVDWHARRRYPRALQSEVPIGVNYGVAFLADERGGITPEQLEWSHRLIGARRAALEKYSEWRPGPGQTVFAIVPGDFEGNGPHRMALQARVRTAGLTGEWEIELPAVPFSFEFDARLDVASLLTLPDEGRDSEIARAIRLEIAEVPEDVPPPFLTLNAGFVLRNPPVLAVATSSLPCDLAHRVFLVFDGVPGRFAAGTVVLSGQGGTRAGASILGGTNPYPLDPLAPLPADAIERPGPRRLRAVLEPDPELGWTDPEIRSLWPGTIATEWCEVEVLRR